jgi:hypothetical protein
MLYPLSYGGIRCGHRLVVLRSQLQGPISIPSLAHSADSFSSSALYKAINRLTGRTGIR